MENMVKGTPAPKDRDMHKDEEFDGIIAVDPNRDGKPSLGFDYERYAALLGDVDISLEDKQMITKALWGVVMQFVEMGFGVHPVQTALEARSQRESDHTDASSAACGQVEEHSGEAESQLLHSSETETEDA